MSGEDTRPEGGHQTDVGDAKPNALCTTYTNDGYNMTNSITLAVYKPTRQEND